MDAIIQAESRKGNDEFVFVGSDDVAAKLPSTSIKRVDDTDMVGAEQG